MATNLPVALLRSASLQNFFKKSVEKIARQMDPSTAMPTPAATAILNFGKLLLQNYKTGRDEAKIQAAEEKLIEMLSVERCQLLRAALDFNSKGKNIEPLVLRAISLVAFCTLCTTHTAPAVGQIAVAVAGDDPSRIMETRETLSKLCIRGDLVLSVRVGS